MHKRKRITICFFIVVSMILTLSACNQADQVNQVNDNNAIVIREDTEKKGSNTVSLDKNDKTQTTIKKSDEKKTTSTSKPTENNDKNKNDKEDPTQENTSNKNNKQTNNTFANGPKAGNPNGNEPIPDEAKPEDVSNPDHVIGNGTPESCTAEAFIDAVAKGGKIVFNTGNQPVTITLNRPAKIFNANPDVVIDGGGLVTLSGGNKNRILYMNTCDQKQGWITSHADNQSRPRLTVQNVTFVNGNSTNDKQYEGGGAIWVRGGRFKVINCRFFNNVCASKGPDVGGGALRVTSQYNNLPVYVVNSTFGGKEGYGNSGSNGGALSSIGVTWTIINSVFSYNWCTGNGGNPAKAGTPGGGSGGAIYNDGNKMTLTILGSKIENNKVNAYGAAIFFVTNNHTGDIRIKNSVIQNNTGGSWYPVYNGISMHDDTKINVSGSSIR